MVGGGRRKRAAKKVKLYILTPDCLSKQDEGTRFLGTGQGMVPIWQKLTKLGIRLRLSMMKMRMTKLEVIIMLELFCLLEDDQTRFYCGCFTGKFG